MNMTAIYCNLNWVNCWLLRILHSARSFNLPLLHHLTCNRISIQICFIHLQYLCYYFRNVGRILTWISASRLFAYMISSNRMNSAIFNYAIQIGWHVLSSIVMSIQLMKAVNSSLKTLNLWSNYSNSVCSILNANITDAVIWISFCVYVFFCEIFGRTKNLHHQEEKKNKIYL